MRSASGRPIRRGLDTFDDLLAEAVVLVGAARLRREGEDRLAMSGALFEANALGDRGFENASAEHLAHRLLNVSSEGRALVVEGDDGAEKLELGVGPGADPVDRLEQIVGAFESEI